MSFAKRYAPLAPLLALFSLAFVQSAWSQAWKGEAASDLVALADAAKEGDPAAMADYAFHSLRCVGGVSYDPTLIFSYFSRSAAAGNRDGKAGLAHCQAYAVGTILNLPVALRLSDEVLSEGAHPEARKVRAYLELGFDGILKRNEKAFYEGTVQAAAAGSVGARFNLGIAFQEGFHVEKDEEEAQRIWRKLHEDGVSPMATNRVLAALRDQEIASRDGALYRECYNRAHINAKLGEPDSLYELAGCYRRAGDEETALGYFIKAADRGSKEACYELWYARDQILKGMDLLSNSQGIDRLARMAYDRGDRTERIVTAAAWEYLASAKSPRTQAMMPQLEKDLMLLLVKKEKENKIPTNIYYYLANLYGKANPKIHPVLARRDLALNYMQAHAYKSSSASRVLAIILSHKKASDEELAMAWASAQWSAGLGDHLWTRERKMSQLEARMSPAVMARAKELVAEEFPHAQRFRDSAEEYLKTHGRKEHVLAKARGES